MKITPLISIESIQVYDFRLDGLEIKTKIKKRRRKNPIEMPFSTSYQNKRAGRADCLCACVHTYDVCIRMVSNKPCIVQYRI